MKIDVSRPERTLIVAALQAYITEGMIDDYASKILDLAARIAAAQEADPTSDGPEVDILRHLPLYSTSGITKENFEDGIHHND